MILGDRKHFVRNLQDAYLFREALGARTRPRVAFEQAGKPKLTRKTRMIGGHPAN
jgi:hypothetical protein